MSEYSIIQEPTTNLSSQLMGIWVSKLCQQTPHWSPCFPPLMIFCPVSHSSYKRSLQKLSQRMSLLFKTLHRLPCVQSKDSKGVLTRPYTSSPLCSNLILPLARSQLALAAGPHTFALVAPVAWNGHEFHFLQRCCSRKAFPAGSNLKSTPQLMPAPQPRARSELGMDQVSTQQSWLSRWN